jgi:hypothetical protein
VLLGGARHTSRKAVKLLPITVITARPDIKRICPENRDVEEYEAGKELHEQDKTWLDAPILNCVESYGRYSEYA